MEGFFQRLLSIDVGTGQVQVETLDPELLQTTLGGKGLATHLLLERNPTGVDPLSARNHLLFALGPATDTPVWGRRVARDRRCARVAPSGRSHPRL
ncbi:MAG: aldehyde ferredoxin oxidoreductase N-terminal domain-containing protein, partial [Desulfovermiculus sp.]